MISQRIQFIALFCFFITYHSAYPQDLGSSADDFPEKSVWLINGFIGFDSPHGDLAYTTGLAGNGGLGLFYKNKKNWLWGIDGSFMFGGNVKKNTVVNLLTTEGHFIGTDGNNAEVRAFFRGYRLPNIRFGRVFNVPLFSANPYSGIFATVGVGYITYWLHLQDVHGTVRPLKNDYLAGYDVKANGFTTSQQLGYLYLDKNRKINIYVCVEFMQGFTQQRKPFIYDVLNQNPNLSQNFDFTIGGRVGIIIPVYGKSDKDYYYY